MDNIAERVKMVVVGHLGVDAGKVVEGANFVTDLGADSLEAVELIMALEESFGVEINDAAARKIETVGDAINYIKGNAEK